MSTIPTCPWLIRELFNQWGLAAQADSGVLIKQLLRRGTPDPARHQLPGTVAEVWRYIDPTIGPVAVVHQDVLPGGAVARRGPDPKMLRDGPALLIPAHKDPETCSSCESRGRS